MNPRRSRQYRRVAQACENCRRKKIRCLGQRPKCSACTRIGQQCCYSDNDYSNDQIADEVESRVAGRLQQLERKLDMIIGRTDKPQSTEQVTPVSAFGTGPSISASSPTTELASPIASTQLPPEIITQALNVYFEHVHRQPLWLFDPFRSPTPDNSDELTCAIIGLSLTYSPTAFTSTDLQAPDFYTDTSRRLIMFKIAEGNVKLQTLQALCLLAFFNVVSGDLTLAGLNLGIAKNLVQYSMLQHRFAQESTSPEEHSKLFWSISFLDNIYGPPTLVPTVTDDITTPRLSSVEATYSSIPGPPLPQESHTATSGDGLRNVWAHAVRIGALWGDVRKFVSRCVEGIAKAPWQPNSDYVTLCSRLLDLEIAFPGSLSYNTIKYPGRSSQEVQDDRAYWLPWVRLQVTYHVIHCALNHPFVYSFKASKQSLGSNTFWRTSSETALRHCTWISRHIRMAREKGLELADPFFAQAAAIAGSMHLYWTRADDPVLRTSASTNLSVCTTLITEMGLHWPVCRSIGDTLQELVDLVTPPDQRTVSKIPTVVATTSLMWLLLDVASPQFPGYVADRSGSKTTVGVGLDIGEFTAVEDLDMNTHASDMRESTAHYASPPAWLSPRSGDRISTDEAQMPVVTGQTEVFENSFHQMLSSREDGTASLDLSWGPWEQIMRTGDGSVSDINWWEAGNL
ncbi:hypothetical protein B0J13DRAFT_564197 [Dactylonectria estremocensis]|uniref:Zn(2)-C6 fungal-type domain-containing protein n=1 Tax=Dactylonectria estremocensis TaxID=1079267 RepID=A0A9P9ISK2_9HYPO|nr:hypothetical protein B0J13DRAFT_564197 [Dactylonectria estremocensis]